MPDQDDQNTDQGGEQRWDPEHTGPVGERRRDLPAVPPARPRATGEQPAYHPTTEIDLTRGFPPVSHETAEIDLSKGWPTPPPPYAARRPAGRVLGVDVGTVRVGVALSDATGTLASPLETLARAKDESDLDRLAALVVEHEVTEVVVGEPRHLSGASGASARDAETYAQALAGRTGDVPVLLVDERLSTVSAASNLRASGRSSREQRSVIDQAAAVVILQSYLDARRSRA
jgi:putative holliday junction resolvase